MARAYRRVWTEEDCRLVIRLYPYANNRALAARLDVGVGALKMKAKALGVKKAPECRGDLGFLVKLSDEDVELVRKLKEEGMGAALIAEKMGITKRYVYRLVNYERRSSLIAPVRKG